MKTEQGVLDFTDVADTVIVLALDGQEVEVPRRDVVAVPGSRRHRYLRPESLLEPAPVCTTPPPRFSGVARP